MEGTSKAKVLWKGMCGVFEESGRVFCVWSTVGKLASEVREVVEDVHYGSPRRPWQGTRILF